MTRLFLFFQLLGLLCGCAAPVSPKPTTTPTLTPNPPATHTPTPTENPILTATATNTPSTQTFGPTLTS